jgi:hypothetical protein
MHGDFAAACEWLLESGFGLRASGNGGKDQPACPKCMRLGLPLEDMIAQWSPQRLRIHVAALGFSARYDDVSSHVFAYQRGPDNSAEVNQ